MQIINGREVIDSYDKGVAIGELADLFDTTIRNIISIVFWYKISSKINNGEVT